MSRGMDYALTRRHTVAWVASLHLPPHRNKDSAQDFRCRPLHERQTSVVGIGLIASGECVIGLKEAYGLTGGH
jgi:hypothetical protein